MKSARFSTKQKRRTRSKKSSAIIAGLFVIAAVALIVLGSWGIGSIIQANNQSRLDRIEEIYTSLKLNSAYAITGQELFGEKKQYASSSDKTYASWTSYVHSDTVDATYAEIDDQIRSAGFERIEDPEEDAAITQATYQSKKGEYIKVSVASKPFADAFENASSMDKEVLSRIAAQYDTNAGPSNVIIYVNLDTNSQ